MLQITALLVLFYVKLALLSHILGILQQETTSQIETRRKRWPERKLEAGDEKMTRKKI